MVEVNFSPSSNVIETHKNKLTPTFIAVSFKTSKHDSGCGTDKAGADF